MNRYQQQLNRVLVFAELHGSASDKLAAAEVRQSQQAQGEPVNRMTETAPKEIFLQVSNRPLDRELDFAEAGSHEDVLWSESSGECNCEVKYVRADLCLPPAPAAVPEKWHKTIAFAAEHLKTWLERDSVAPEAWETIDHARRELLDMIAAPAPAEPTPSADMDDGFMEDVLRFAPAPAAKGCNTDQFEVELCITQNVDDLPGMWDRSDFEGGDPDERSYAEQPPNTGDDGTIDPWLKHPECVITIGLYDISKGVEGAPLVYSETGCLNECGIYPGNWCRDCPKHRNNGRAEQESRGKWRPSPGETVLFRPDNLSHLGDIWQQCKISKYDGEYVEVICLGRIKKWKISGVTFKKSGRAE